MKQFAQVIGGLCLVMLVGLALLSRTENPAFAWLVWLAGGAVFVIGGSLILAWIVGLIRGLAE
jgi:hypothetical protein